jgi:hypothetical protein
MIRTLQARLRPAAAPTALVAALILTGCQEDLGSSPAAFDDAPIVAEERLDSAVNSVRKTIGDPAAQPSEPDDGTTGVDGSPVSVVEEQPVAGAPVTGGDAAGQDKEQVAITEPEETGERSLEEPEPPVLEWSAPLTREDGSSLADGEIRGYQLYYRLRHQEEFQTLFVKSDSGTRLPLEDFDPGAYEFSITTVDTDGLESRRSDPVAVDII